MRVVTQWLFVFTFLAGCSNGGGGTNGVFANPRTPMTNEELAAAIAAVTTTVNDAIPLDPKISWSERDPVAELESAAKALVKLDEVVGVNIHMANQSATVILADGVTLSLINNRPPPFEELSLDFAKRGEDSPSVRDTDLANVLPPSKKAVLASFDGGGEVADELSEQIADAGYTVSDLSHNIEDMLEYKDLGFLYLDTHGSSFALYEKIYTKDGKVKSLQAKLDVNGNPVPLTYVYQSSTEISVDELTRWRQEIEDGEVALAIAPDWFHQATDGWIGGHNAKFGITERFIEKHWELEDAVVLLHICYAGAKAPFNNTSGCVGNCPLGTTTYDPRPTRNAVFDAGANVVMAFDGLTWPTAAAPSMKYFLDRLLGANVVEPQTPANRPLPWDLIVDTMGTKGLLDYQWTSGTINVNIEGSGAPPVALRPSITSVQVADDLGSATSILELKGTFGATMGEVYFNGSSRTIVEWHPDRIVARIPVDVSGKVHVVTNELISNEVPLTMWTGKLTYRVIQDNTLESRAEINVRFRGDVHGHREKADGALSATASTAYISSPFVNGDTEGIGSSGNIQHGPGEEMVIYGKSAIDNLVQSNPPTSGFSGISGFAGLVELNPDMDEARFCIWIEGYHQVLNNGELEPEMDSYFYIPFAVGNSTKGSLNCFHAPLENGNIVTGSYTFTSGTTFILEWTEFVTSEPPTTNTPG